ncbi:MAG: aspartate aminotransferase family protein [Veillonella sp.]|uniref:aspartate aminotransferase family protein n=1 Tax=Veillonella sp. TaxID=1926307 RepID=UPI001B4AE15A|nr:aspartate aminotransferase family protein [Veillonella sp.]MBP6922803.1 aspartate aminotransferase family protein [Veillonella sp.]MBP8616824.1 aspartate aminotransferase family protein [Veillonella sp.]MBP9516711.1 aspartate aminotransferase family protein [Veillonella sp.]MBP9550535.1 aspartate aminotransferase family protein [Veillonella sp.]
MLSRELPKIVTASVPGPKCEAVIKRRADATLGAIRCPYPVVIDHAQGAVIEDLDGNRYLDWIGGVGVLNIGHCHPEVVEVVKAQSEKYFHAMFNVVTHEGYIALAEKMNEIVPVKGDKRKTFFANSGAEADENAIKFAKAFTQRPNIIVFSGAFHGRTLLTMSMTAKKAYAKGMGPFPDGVYRTAFPYFYRSPSNSFTEEETINYCIKNLEEVFRDGAPANSVAAIVLEPLQGEGGFIPAPIEWVKALRKICNDNGILLIADEIQTGFCRTGRMFATEAWRDVGAAPDIVTFAKSIAAGIPLSGVTARTEIFDAVPGGVAGGTFGGNALACAAALKTIEIMERDDLAGRSRDMGAKVIARYAEWVDKYDCIGDYRGLGGMIGIEFVKNKITKEPAPELVDAIIAYTAAHGLLVENAGVYSNVIRFLAPLVMTDAQLEAGLEIFEDAIKTCSK